MTCPAVCDIHTPRMYVQDGHHRPEEHDVGCSQHNPYDSPQRHGLAYTPLDSADPSSQDSPISEGPLEIRLLPEGVLVRPAGQPIVRQKRAAWHGTRRRTNIAASWRGRLRVGTFSLSCGHLSSLLGLTCYLSQHFNGRLTREGMQRQGS